MTVKTDELVVTDLALSYLCSLAANYHLTTYDFEQLATFKRLHMLFPQLTDFTQ